MSAAWNSRSRHVHGDRCIVGRDQRLGQGLPVLDHGLDDHLADLLDVAQGLLRGVAPGDGSAGLELRHVREPPALVGLDHDAKDIGLDDTPPDGVQPDFMKMPSMRGAEKPAPAGRLPNAV